MSCPALRPLRIRNDARTSLDKTHASVSPPTRTLRTSEFDPLAFPVPVAIPRAPRPPPSPFPAVGTPVASQSVFTFYKSLFYDGTARRAGAAVFYPLGAALRTHVKVLARHQYYLPGAVHAHYAFVIMFFFLHRSCFSTTALFDGLVVGFGATSSARDER